MKQTLVVSFTTKMCLVCFSGGSIVFVSSIVSYVPSQVGGHTGSLSFHPQL